MTKAALILISVFTTFFSGCIIIGNSTCSKAPCGMKSSVVTTEIKAILEGPMSSSDQKQAYLAIAKRGAQQGYTESEWNYLICSLEDSSLSSSDHKEVLMYIIENKKIIPADKPQKQEQ